MSWGPPTAAEAWLTKLEAWLRENQDPDIIYTVLVGHRAGYSAVVTNIDKQYVKDFIDKAMMEKSS